MWCTHPAMACAVCRPAGPDEESQADRAGHQARRAEGRRRPVRPAQPQAGPQRRQEDGAAALAAALPLHPITNPFRCHSCRLTCGLTVACTGLQFALPILGACMLLIVCMVIVVQAKNIGNDIGANLGGSNAADKLGGKVPTCLIRCSSSKIPKLFHVATRCIKAGRVATCPVPAAEW